MKYEDIETDSCTGQSGTGELFKDRLHLNTTSKSDLFSTYYRTFTILSPDMCYSHIVL